MTNFLNEQRRQKLKAQLIERDIPEDMAETVTSFSEVQADANMFAHALAIIKGSQEEECQRFVIWSGLILDAIGDEAKERGWNKSHFPRGTAIMDQFVASCERDRKTVH